MYIYALDQKKENCFLHIGVENLPSPYWFTAAELIEDTKEIMRRMCEIGYHQEGDKKEEELVISVIPVYGSEMNFFYTMKSSDVLGCDLLHQLSRLLVTGITIGRRAMGSHAKTISITYKEKKK